MHYNIVKKASRPYLEEMHNKAHEMSEVWKCINTLQKTPFKKWFTSSKYANDEEISSIINKPQNISTLNDRNSPINVLNWARSYCENAKVCHRLDKNTSGIIVIAKTQPALVHLQKQFYDRITSRRYRALVWGDFDQNEGTIIGNIGRSLRNRKVMDVFPEGSEYGRHAVTHYSVLERFGYVTLVECRLETGRTHQIRAHFKHIGHPLFNDDTYGGDKVLRGTTFSKYKQFVQNCFKIMPRHALHAKSLGFHHPKNDEWMQFDSSLPPDLSAVLDRWRNYTEQRIQKVGE